APLQFEEQYSWIEAFGVYWALGADGISITLIVLTAVVTPLVVMAMWREAEPERRDPKPFFAMLLLLEAMVIGAFAAKDVLLFYILFEAMLVPMYFLIGMYGGPQRRYAAMKFLLYNLFGGLIMLAAVIGLYVQSVQAGEGTFLLAELVALEIRWRCSAGCSSASCSPSRSRRRCGRSTPGCRMPRPRRPRPTRRTCRASWTRSAPSP